MVFDITMLLQACLGSYIHIQATNFNFMEENDKYLMQYNQVVELLKVYTNVSSNGEEEFDVSRLLGFNKITKKRIKPVIQMFIDDALEGFLYASPAEQNLIISKLNSETKDFLLSALSKKSKVTKKILKRGKILDDTEFYILKEYSIREQNVPETVFDMLHVYEFRDQQAR